jgi:TetR/AcrR family transcriptional regulator of autoinduction and epiphytic fitness
MSSENKRQDILDAAIEEFRENGFAGAAMSRISSRAKVSSRTLYRHFESKEALFDAIVETACQNVQSIEVLSFDPGKSLKPQFMALAKAYVDAVTREEHVAMDQIATVAFIRDQGLSSRASNHQAMQDHPVFRFIQKAADHGHLSCADPAFAAQQLLVMIKGFFCSHILLPSEQDTGSKSKQDVLSDCVDMFLAQYGAVKTS